MAFGKPKAPAGPPPTRGQIIKRHQRLAEDHLQRAAKAGRMEAETRHATMATAHATLALTYLIERDDEDAQVPTLDRSED